jgi:hypothetical protein
MRREGDRGIAHQLRGRESNRKYEEGFRERVIGIYRKNYEGFGPLLASEKLGEREKIKVSDETLRKWLIAEGLWQKGRRHRKHRSWRARRGHYGEMVQMDGSHHDWFEGRGPWCVVMGYIDDATGRVYARFGEYEGTIPVMESFRGYIRRHGIPSSVYLDRHSTYKQIRVKLTVEEELAGRELLSEFERAAQELGVRVIHAYSPQAKGRVERLFRTFQDRLIKEMRIEKIKSIEEGNKFLDKYLPVYNERFSVIARESGDMHGAVPRSMDLDRILCIKTERTVRNDYTVAHDRKLYQILDNTRASTVSIEERLDGTMKIYNGERMLEYKEIENRPERWEGMRRRWKKRTTVTYVGTKGWKPPAEHPWRKYKVSAVMAA